MAKRKTYLAELNKALTLTFSPWRDNNRFKLLINAEVFFPAMLEAIENAKHSVLLEMYLFEPGFVADQFIDQLTAAARRGVKVYLLLDDYGCRALKQVDRNRFIQKNIQIHYYNPIRYAGVRRNLFRDHRKLLLVDLHTAFVGGAGITDEFQTFDSGKPGWRETMVEMQGECVADWVETFRQVWQLYGKLDLPKLEAAPDKNTDLLGRKISLHPHASGRVVCALGSGRQSIKSSVQIRIRHSKKRCWIATAYFVPSFKIRVALKKAAMRGVDVRLLLPGPISDHPGIRFAARRFYFRMLSSGVKIYEYQPRFMHQKVLMCDDWVSIGSSNIDRWNFRWNLDANQEIKETDFLQSVTNMFEVDFRHSKQFSLEEWNNRSLYRRLQEIYWGIVDWVIDRIR